MSLDHLYNSTFSTQRPVTTQNELGGGAEVFSTNISSFKGRLQAKTSSETQENGQITVLSDYVLYCDPANDVTEIDRVIYGTRTFEVSHVDNSNQMDNHLRIELLEIT